MKEHVKDLEENKKLINDQKKNFTEKLNHKNKITKGINHSSVPDTKLTKNSDRDQKSITSVAKIEK